MYIRYPLILTLNVEACSLSPTNLDAYRYWLMDGSLVVCVRKRSVLHPLSGHVGLKVDSLKWAWSPTVGVIFHEPSVNICFSLSMYMHIERKLPAQLLESRGGFALGSIRMSWVLRIWHVGVTNACIHFWITWRRQTDCCCPPSCLRCVMMERRR